MSIQNTHRYKFLVIMLTLLPALTVTPLIAQAEVTEEIIEDITTEPTPEEPTVPVEPELPENPIESEGSIPPEEPPASIVPEEPPASIVPEEPKESTEIPVSSGNSSHQPMSPPSDNEILNAITQVPNVESVDIANRMITGIASPAAMITVFYDNHLLDNITADAIGNWQAVIPEGLNIEDGEFLKVEFNSNGVRTSVKKEIDTGIPTAKKKKALIQGNRIEQMQEGAIEETPENIKRQITLGMLSILLIAVLAYLTPKIMKYMRFF